MTLPSSGLLTMQDINVEMGRSANTPFTLNDADVRALAGVPSGPYSMSAFYGKSRATLRNPLNNSVQFVQAGGSPLASMTYRPDGTCLAVDDGTNGTPANWLSPTTPGIGSGYWFRYDVQSGVSPNVGGLTAGTWYQMTSNLTIGLQVSAGARTGSYTVSIATSASLFAVVAQGTLNAYVDTNG